MVTLLKAALGVTWQIIPIIMVITYTLNLSLIYSIWAPEKHNIYIYIYIYIKLSINIEFVNVQLI